MNDLTEFGLSAAQIRTDICLEKLKLSRKEKAKADKKIAKIITNHTLEEINNYIDKWCIKKYIIYMLDDIVFLFQDETLVLEMAKFNNRLEASFNASLKLARKSSYLD